MSKLYEEIREQPIVLARLLQEGRPLAEEFAAQIRKFQPQSVVIAARGSSHNAAHYGQYLFQSQNRLIVSLATPSLFTLYRQVPNLARTLVIGISQSGQSLDVTTVVEEARRQGALTLAITNDPDSPLARAAQVVFPLWAGEERSIAATKTYTCELLALAILSTALAPRIEYWRELDRIPTVVAQILEQGSSLAEQVGAFVSTAHIAVIGRGFQYATACEIALKLQELCSIVALPFSAADFRHGPIALITPGFPVLVIAPSGTALADLLALLDTLKKRGAQLLAISDLPEIVRETLWSFRLPANLPEWLSPIPAVVPGQLFALYLSQARGLDPDQPRGLQKITVTK